MENLSRTMEKDITTRGLSNQNKRSRNWQLLFVDDHGKMVSFSWLKSAAILIITALIFFMVCTSLLFALYRNNQSENIRLKEKLNESSKKFKSLRNETDILLAKLVLTESKITLNHDKDLLAEEKQTIQEIKKESVPLIASLEVTNFKISKGFGSTNTFKISFVIKNIDRSVKTVSGYIFIVLKQYESDRNTWFSVPSTDLQRGYPINAKKGQFFKISRFKTVYFRARTQISLEQLKIASVFVLNDHGDRIFEKSFPITYQPKKSGNSTLKTVTMGHEKKVLPIVKPSSDKKRSEEKKPEDIIIEKKAEFMVEKQVEIIPE
jgi:hypothetical protein